MSSRSSAYPSACTALKNWLRCSSTNSPTASSPSAAGGGPNSGITSPIALLVDCRTGREGDHDDAQRVLYAVTLAVNLALADCRSAAPSATEHSARRWIPSLGSSGDA